MKKIIYTLLMLLLCGAQTLMAADADGYIKYRLKTTGDFPKENSASRGVFRVKNDNDKDYRSGINNSADTQTPKRWTVNSDGAYIKCESTTPFAKGDTISIVATPRTASSAGFQYALEKDDSHKAEIAGIYDNKNKQLVLKDTIEEGNGLIGKNYFYLSVKDPSHSFWIESITVTSAFPTAQSVQISDNMQYATYSNPTYSVDFTDSGAKAYIVKQGESTDKITFTEVTKVPAKTGVLLMGTKGSTVTIKATNEEENDVTGNLLVADDGQKTVGAGVYILSYKDDKAAFYKSNENRTLAEGKAHLEFPSAVATTSLAFYLDDVSTLTGIEGVQAEDVEAEDASTSEVYNLSGQKVDSNYKGIVIKNGKKYLQK